MAPIVLNTELLLIQSNIKTDKWTAKNMVSGWIDEFSKLTAGKSDRGISYQALKSHEDEFVVLIEQNDKKLDSLWKNGILLKDLIGKQNALKYKTEADSALSIVTNNLLANFNEYSVRIVNARETDRDKWIY